MLSGRGSMSFFLSLLTAEGKHTFSGYLLHVPCFGICLPVPWFVWEHAVLRRFEITGSLVSNKP